LPTSPTLNRLTLPADPPGPRFEVSAELNELLRPDEASRIRVLTGLDHPEEVTQGLLFQLRVELRFNKDGADQSGPVLISLPGPLQSGAYWRALAAEPDNDPFSACAARNVAALDYMLNLSGARSPDLAAVTTS
jgi:hypothetical protein